MDKLERDLSAPEIYWSSWGFAKKGQLGNFKHANFSVNPVLIEVNNSITVKPFVQSLLNDRDPFNFGRGTGQRLLVF